MTRDPFLIPGPLLVNVSGGRTSGYMLRRIIDAHGGSLPEDVIPVFCNTGKEMDETLDFVRDIGERWAVRVRWLEYRWEPGRHYFEEVGHNSASRNGEPFDMAIQARQILPNVMARFCTQEMKIRTMQRFAWSLGWKDYTSAVGLRADEPGRVARLRARNATGKDVWDVVMPLAEAGVTRQHVVDFWRRQPFDLRLQNVNGRTPHGNCDMCFLKSTSTLLGIMRDMPERARWWIGKEAQAMGKAGSAATFSKRRTYAGLMARVRSQRNLDPSDDIDETVDCFCGEGT